MVGWVRSLCSVRSFRAFPPPQLADVACLCPLHISDLDLSSSLSNSWEKTERNLSYPTPVCFTEILNTDRFCALCMTNADNRCPTTTTLCWLASPSRPTLPDRDERPTKSAKDDDQIRRTARRCASAMRLQRLDYCLSGFEVGN